MVTQKNLNELKSLARKYKVRLYFAYNKTKHDVCGYFLRKSNSIVIVVTNNKNRDELLGTFFHELGHVYCCKKGIWKNYHSRTHVNKKNVNLLRRTALKAERYVDIWGFMECEKYDPKIRYRAAYFTLSGIKWFRENYMNKYYKI